MPNLNLIEEEGGGEGTMQPVSAPTRRKGGGGSKVVIIFVVLLLLGGGVFALNKYGIINLWGKKKPVVAQVQEEPFPADEYADTTAAMQDTTSIAFVDTPPIDEGKKEATTTSMDMGLEGGRLAEMKGSYTIQVSAWRDQATADTYVKRLEDAGYPAYVHKRALKDGAWYTVRIGRYPSRKDARKAIETFALEIKSHYWIDRVRM